jgi:membrane associated rhomboid family serine protease
LHHFSDKPEPTQPSFLAKAGRRLKSQALTLGGFLSIIWFVSIFNLLLFDGGLNVYGIRPRTVEGLWGILLMPFLHGSFGHLFANSLPFATLGWLVMLRRTADFYIVTAVTLVISGFGVWLTGPTRSVHIGASGLVFGYFGFLLLRGYFERSLYALLFAFLVFVIYGSLLWGVLPQQDGISWQAHFFGFCGGVLAARFLTRPGGNPLTM